MSTSGQHANPPSAATSTSLSLLRRIKAGDQEAWVRLVRLYGPLVHHWCQRANVSGTDLPDILQTVLLGAFTGIGGYRADRPDSTFRGWLRILTRNKIADYFQHRRKQLSAVGGSDHQLRMLAQLAQPDLPDDDADGAGVWTGVVQRALDFVRPEFAARTWEIFWATVDGRSTKEIAAQYGVTAAAVRVAKSRVLGRLRAELGDLDDLDDLGDGP